MATATTDFGDLAQKRGRWNELMAKLEAADVGHIEHVPIPKAENDGEGRHRIRQSIYSIARKRRLIIAMHSNANEILVKKLGTVKAQAAHA